MSFTFRHIISIFLLWVFLFPMIVKFEHHHDNETHKLSNELGIQSQEEDCPICTYEFSTFSNQFDTFVQSKKISFQILLCHCLSEFYNNTSLLNNSLRAPPLPSL